MKDIVKKFYDKEIPIIGWTFFASERDANSIFNESTWSGWSVDWDPVASNGMGDAVVIYKDALYGVQHGAGASPKAALITNNIHALELLLNRLLEYGFREKNESIEEMRKNRDYLLQLRKIAPRSLKIDFTIEVDNIKEAISDLRFNNSKEGKFISEAGQIQKTALADLRRGDRYSEIRLKRREKKLAFYVSGKLNRGESLDEIKSVFSKYSFSFPIEYELDNNA